MSGRAKNTVALGVLASLLTLSAVGAYAEQPAAPPPGDQSARAAQLACRNEALRQELELAKGTDFYLVLDSGRNVLRFMLSGVTLKEYALLDLAIGIRRSPFREAPPSDFLQPPGTGGSLDPPRDRDRFELVVAPGGTSEPPPEVPVPPPAEELYLIPTRYWIRFDTGIALEVRSAEPGRRGWKEMLTAGIWEPLRNAFADLWHPPRDKVRVRLDLERDDAADLYRVLPPATKLLVLPPC
ncbi:MAG: hypothetical protein V1774_06570 [Candidatus Eisenbacteria bacterium]